jgi:hypothetical protein
VVHGRDRCLLLVCEPCDRRALLENVSPCLTPSGVGVGAFRKLHGKFRIDNNILYKYGSLGY